MKHLPSAAIFTAAIVAFTMPSFAATVTAGDLAKRCKSHRSVCETSIKWISDNTSACIRTNQTHDQVVTKVIAWLKKHPTQKGSDDNDVTGFAIDALWPCE